MWENIYQLYICLVIANQNTQAAQKPKLPKSQWPYEEICKWTEQNFLKGRSQNL
jgi:hypothetical protein